jgi:hypothetical protein
LNESSGAPAIEKIVEYKKKNPDASIREIARETAERGPA